MSFHPSATGLVHVLTGVTYTALYWLRFQRDKLVVDGGQMVSLVLVGALIYTASFIFLLCQLDSRVSTLVFFMDTECPVAWQWSTPAGLSRFVCSLNIWLRNSESTHDTST